MAVWPGDTPLHARGVAGDPARATTSRCPRCTFHGSPGGPRRRAQPLRTPTGRRSSARPLETVSRDPARSSCVEDREAQAGASRRASLPSAVSGAQRVLFATGTLSRPRRRFERRLHGTLAGVDRYALDAARGACSWGSIRRASTLFDSKDAPGAQGLPARATIWRSWRAWSCDGVPEGLYELIALPLQASSGFDASPGPRHPPHPGAMSSRVSRSWR